MDGWSSVLRPRQHSIGYTGDGFYRSKDPTNSIKVLKEMLQNRKKTTKTTKHTYTPFHQLPPFETLEFTLTAMSRWGLTTRKRYRPATRYCINCTIRQSVSRSVLPSLVSSLVLSRLDYGNNSTLAGVSSHLLSRLQSVMNAAARLIFSSWRFQHITLLLRQLHWLKAPERTAFKQSVPVYKCLLSTRVRTCIPYW